MSLKCDGCGEEAKGDVAKIAKAGGAHYERVQHGVGIPGRQQKGFNARSCGTWVEQEIAALKGSTPEPRRG